MLLTPLLFSLDNIFQCNVMCNQMSVYNKLLAYFSLSLCNVCKKIEKYLKGKQREIAFVQLRSIYVRWRSIVFFLLFLQQRPLFELNQLFSKVLGKFQKCVLLSEKASASLEHVYTLIKKGPNFLISNIHSKENVAFYNLK